MKLNQAPSITNNVNSKIARKIYWTLALAILISSQTAFAQSTILPGNQGQSVPLGSSPTNIQSALVAPDTANVQAATQALQGNVHKVELNLEQLQDIGLDLKHLLQAASSLYDEVAIQPVQIITEPEMIIAGTVINIPIATMPVGPPRPARKERVDLAMSGIKPVIDMLKKNVNEFVAGHKEFDLSENVLSKLQPDFKEWVILVDILASLESQLEQLTQDPPYDNKSIAAIVVEMEKKIKDLEKTRHSIYKIVREEGKRLTASEKAEEKKEEKLENKQAQN